MKNDAGISHKINSLAGDLKVPKGRRQDFEQMILTFHSEAHQTTGDTRARCKKQQRRRSSSVFLELRYVQVRAAYEKPKDTNFDHPSLSDEDRINLARASKSTHESLGRQELDIKFDPRLVRKARAIVRRNQRQQDKFAP
jgi:hypothetical protein